MEISLEPNSQLAQHNCPHQKTLRGDKREAARWGIQTAVTLLTYQWNNLQQPLLLCCCNMRDPHICFIDGFLCLSCVYLLCRKESHILEHRQLSGHSLFFDMSFLRMYCFDCKDYVADQLSSSIISSICRLDWTKKTRQVLKKASLPPTVKRQLLWIPSQQELEWIKEYSVSPDEKESTLFPYPGLCGLLNLGNSCYMNAILQVMLHTLPLKRYFLSDSHRSTCSFSRNIQECAACALDDLFMKGFHESFEKDLSEREALSPQFILEIIWRHCDSLASYAQHDAHEFFITFVNVLRQHIICEDACPKKERNGMKVNGREVIDHLFSGVIESHVYCGGCKRYSATLEDYFDISLDLNHSSQMEKEEMECNESVRTLQECLTYFTSPEELDNGTTRYCDYCQQHTSFYKRVAIQRLPQILCFHLKRFQHGLDGKGVSSKIESEIGFPIRSLDMSRYISSEILERNDLPQASPIGVERDDEEDIQFKSISKAKKDDEISSSFIQNDFPLSESKEYLCSRSTKEQLSELNDGSNMNTSLWNIQSNYNEEEIFYDLYAVVNHIGKMDHGHYITWIREQNTWLKCDDEVISVEPFSTESVASSSQAYLLFYISRKLPCRYFHLWTGKSSRRGWIRTNWSGRPLVSFKLPTKCLGNYSTIRSCLESNVAKQKDIHNRVFTDKLFLTRQQLNRCKSSLQLSYRSTLEEIGILEYGDVKEAVEIKLLVQKCGSDYIVKSRVNTCLTCECDRCLNPFRLAVEGYFQLLLSSNPNVQEVDHSVVGGEEKETQQLTSTTVVGFEDLEMEVWEPFTSDVDQVSLYSHVYDSVMLSLPSKILCDESCPGIPIGEYRKNVVSESLLSISQQDNESLSVDTEDKPVGWEDIYQLKNYFENRKNCGK